MSAWRGITEVTLSEALGYFKKRSEIHESTKKAIAKGPPNVHEVSPYEVYLINPDGTRGRRICGAKRANLPPQYVCLMPAGKGTDHVGVGRCRIHHSGKWPDISQFSSSRNLALGKAGSFEAHMAQAVVSYEDSSDLVNLRPEILMMDACLKAMSSRLDLTLGRSARAQDVRLIADLSLKQATIKEKFAAIYTKMLEAGSKPYVVQWQIRCVELVRRLCGAKAAVAILRIIEDHPNLGLDLGMDDQEFFAMIEGQNRYNCVGEGKIE